ncbi:MAG: peptide chain release factor-like protein [Phycisphaerae bacterium]|nr:peptide chain release factor-like protein [Phycisphaerae bacterium]
MLRDCDIARTRRSGPGGQHRNKTETAVVIVHRPTGVSAEASERRSQSENQTHAVFRLRLHLAVAIRVAPPAAPSPLWRSRTGQGRIVVNPGHADFPSILAEALDILAVCDFDPKPAADRLVVTPSQLVKLLWKEPAALEMVNRRRAESGLHPLK